LDSELGCLLDRIAKGLRSSGSSTQESFRRFVFAKVILADIRPIYSGVHLERMVDFLRSDIPLLWDLKVAEVAPFYDAVSKTTFFDPWSWDRVDDN
jgi:hypothetical protein